MRKHLVEVVGRSAALSTLVGWLEGGDRGRSGLLRVLTYHQVEWPQADPPPYPRACLPPPVFAEQLELLATRYRPVAIEQVLEAVRGRAELPPRAVLLTFDDAYRDFEAHAWPLLKQHRLPVTLFVPTAYPGDPSRWFWWSRLHDALLRTPVPRLATPVGELALGSPAARRAAYDRLRAHLRDLPHAAALARVEEICASLGVEQAPPPVLDWDALRRLAAEGVSLGSHTRTHPLMDRIEPAVMREEIVGARRDLEREIGDVPPVFAYPGGGVDDHAVQLLAAEGYELAFTTRRGINDLRRADALRLRRINVGTRTTPALLRAQLLGVSVYLNKLAGGDSRGTHR